MTGGVIITIALVSLAGLAWLAGCVLKWVIDTLEAYANAENGGSD